MIENNAVFLQPLTNTGCYMLLALKFLVDCLNSIRYRHSKVAGVILKYSYKFPGWFNMSSNNAVNSPFSNPVANN